MPETIKQLFYSLKIKTAIPSGNGCDFHVISHTKSDKIVFKQAPKEAGRFTRTAPEKAAFEEKEIESISQITLKEGSGKQKAASFFKEKFLTAFNWKYVKVKVGNSNMLVNIDDVATKIGLKPSDVRKHAEKGTLIDACQSKLAEKTQQDFSKKIKDGAVPIPVGSELEGYLNRNNTKDGELKKTFFYFDQTSNDLTFPDSNDRVVTYRAITDEAYRFENIYVYQEGGQFFVNVENATVKFHLSSTAPEQIEGIKDLVEEKFKKGHV